MKERVSRRNTLLRALYHWFRAIVKPGETFEDLKADVDKVAVSFWITLVFSFLYSMTALLGYLTGQVIMVEPWIPVAKESYYLYQTFWTIPWGLATWAMLAGISHLLALLGRSRDHSYAYEDALYVVAIGWVLPWFIFAWLPETFVFIPFSLQPRALIEIIRLGVLPVIWQTLLITVGLRKTHEISWIKGIVIGIITVGVMFIMFLAFLR